jgi:hypothetical protein
MRPSPIAKRITIGDPDMRESANDLCGEAGGPGMGEGPEVLGGIPREGL